MNYLLEFDRLNNRYFAMRHGHSLANAQGIIVSHPDNGCAGYGLSESGWSQVEQCLTGAKDLNFETLVICSDFKRARESANIVHSLLACQAAVTVEQRLRERYFGEYELCADENYDKVWRRDAIDPDDRSKGVECASQVMRRVTSVINDLESQYLQATILLVSHGDALQILQTAFARRAASEHRLLDHLQTAEIRRLKLASSPESG